MCDTDSGKVRTVRKDVVHALRHVIYELKRGRTFDDIIGDANDRIREILADVREVAADNPRRKADEILLSSLRAFEGEVIRRQKSVESGCTWHGRTAYYPEISAALNRDIPDGDDVTVVLDAHDVALTVPGLAYVSGDYNHIVHHTDTILAHTRIASVASPGAVPARVVLTIPGAATIGELYLAI